MKRWIFGLLALPALIAALIAALSLALLLPRNAHAQTATTPASAQEYGAIARAALAAVDQQRGECFLWVRSLVKAALGRNIGYDYHTGYLEAGAIEVPLTCARNGDIMQIANPGNTAATADYPGLHTSIVLDNLGGGKFRVIDSNMNFDGIVHIRDPYTPSEIVAKYPGLVVRVYRLEGTAAPASPAAAPQPAPLQTIAAAAPLPAPGAAVTIAADGDCLRVRSAAGLTGSVLGCLPTGSRATVTQSGPSADGYRWVQVSAGSLIGWVAADYLSLAAPGTTTPAPSVAPSVAVPAPAPPVAAAPPRAAFAARPLYGAGTGQASAVFMGGSIDQLIGAASEAQATGIWVQDASGAFQLLIVGGPTFMVDAFRAKFPAPFGGPLAVTLMGSSS